MFEAGQLVDIQFAVALAEGALYSSISAAGGAVTAVVAGTGQELTAPIAPDATTGLSNPDPEPTNLVVVLQLTPPAPADTGSVSDGGNESWSITIVLTIQPPAGADSDPKPPAQPGEQPSVGKPLPLNDPNDVLNLVGPRIAPGIEKPSIAPVVIPGGGVSWTFPLDGTVVIEPTAKLLGQPITITIDNGTATAQLGGKGLGPKFQINSAVLGAFLQFANPFLPRPSAPDAGSGKPIP